MNIGQFIHDEKTDTYTGNVATLTVHCANVQIRPAAKIVPAEPDYRVVAATEFGTVEIGVAWKRTTRADKEYLSISIDDPVLAAPLNAALFPGENGKAVLVWNRINTKRKAKQAA